MRPNADHPATIGRPTSRRGVTMVLAATLIVVVCAMAAMAIDVGFMMLVRTQLQTAADAGALAAANTLHETRAEIVSVGKQFATSHLAGGRAIRGDETDVEIGIWDTPSSSFAATSGIGNAVRVTCSRVQEGLFFGRVLGIQTFTAEASAIAMANPKDITFVMDLSGSMNDDTEPAWATTTVNNQFGGGAGSDLMRDVYQDFGFGTFPGTLEYIGAPIGVAQGSMAYAEMTSDVGPLSAGGIPAQYRIVPGDDENTRRLKCYSWIIEHQLRRLMPQARPSADISNYGYWEKYLDYVLLSSHVQAPTPPPPPPPATPPGGGSGSGSGGSSGGGSGGSAGGGSGSGSSGTPGGGASGGGSAGGSGSGSSGSSGGSSGGGSSSGSGGSGGGSQPTYPSPPPPAPRPPIGFLPSATAVNRLVASPAGVLPLIAARRLGVDPIAAWPLATQLYGAAASGPGLPRVGGLFGGYSAWLPPSQDGDRIDKFNNPNQTSFPSASTSLPSSLRNFVGYLTYTQFLMDHGRDLRPDGATPVELSVDSPFCPRHNESVAGRTFSFPPREMPMHAVRRAAIAAIDVLEQRNAGIPNSGYRDHVSVVTFDTAAGSRVHQGFTSDYLQAMRSITDLQAAGDKGTTTATETGMILAKQMLRRQSEGGQARDTSTRVVVLLTDGMPNAYESTESAIASFAAGAGAGESYGGGHYWLDAALMQTHTLEAECIDVYPAGVGMGADNGFMDRIARLGGTAGNSGQARRGSGDPTQYERVLTEIFEEIISLPTARMVE